MSESLTLYWMPTCTTCKSAAKYLSEAEQKVAKFHDLKADPLGRDEIQKLAALAGGVDELFSRRAKKYRSMGLNERELSAIEMLDLMESDYTFIKRPVLVRRDRAISGFTPKSYDEFFGAK